jgi:hypothetical protein
MLNSKRDATISFTVPDDFRSKLMGLAEMDNMTLSTYAFHVLMSHIEDKEAKLRIVAEALGLKINDN